MSEKLDVRMTSFCVTPHGDPLYSEFATKVEVDDESGGPFLVISQCDKDGTQKLRLEYSEWVALDDAVRKFARENWPEMLKDV